MADFSLFYGTVAEADDYFTQCLHREGWFGCSVVEKENALKCATRIIERLRYKGYKHALWLKIQSKSCGCLKTRPTKEQRKAANVEQPLQFPRNCDEEVPCDILAATFEIAYELLVECKDPNLDLENLGIKSDQYDVIRTVYRDDIMLTHVANGVPSASAWAYLAPYLGDPGKLLIRFS